MMLQAEIEELEKSVDAVRRKLTVIRSRQDVVQELREPASQQIHELLSALDEDVQVFQKALSVMQSLLQQRV